MEAQSALAVATAQARAGDQAAAQRLPELARIVVELAQAQAQSAFDVSRLRGQVAASLEATARQIAGQTGAALPGTATGFPGAAAPVQAAVLYTAPPMPEAAPPAWAELLAELQGLREDLRAQAPALAGTGRAIEGLLRRWDGEGLPEERSTA